MISFLSYIILFFLKVILCSAAAYWVVSDEKRNPRSLRQNALIILSFIITWQCLNVLGGWGMTLYLKLTESL